MKNFIEENLDAVIFYTCLATLILEIATAYQFFK